MTEMTDLVGILVGGIGKASAQEAEKGLLSQAINMGHSGLLNGRMWPL